MKQLLYFGIIAAVLITGCKSRNSLIQSHERLSDMHRMLGVQKDLTRNGQVPVWEIFDQRLTTDEEQALEFLYAYMPLSDLADYPASFFLANVRQSLKTRSEMPWSSAIPEDIFLHFVLPLRVNNESLDSFRLKMYAEIKKRVQGMDMNDAALEINHWCHEKVNYRSTDARTGSPLSTMKKTFGRCGEESTFTVAAMRTAGIPARQVYTPRWAHVDDNHAWVEVWINGNWNYLGACEPEPVLNMGWFDEPSRRAMLVHTRAYGRYFGQEEVLHSGERFAELNLTARYAPVKTIVISVKNPDGTPARNARVEFGLYNYAEFYPIAVTNTDDQGLTPLTTGLGDLLIWASKDGLYAYQKMAVASGDTLMLTLTKAAPVPHTEIIDILPPHAVKTDSRVNGELRRENDRKLALEDSIRNATMEGFQDSSWSSKLAVRLQLDPARVQAIIAKSYGNWREMTLYLEKNRAGFGDDLLALAGQLSDKDYSDAVEPVLTDHLRNVVQGEGTDRESFVKYVLSPRIYDENLTAWRGYLRAKMEYLKLPVQKDMTLLTRWIKDSILIDESANQHSRKALTPVGVYNLRAADPVSRDIFYVAACRTFGIPARLNPVTLKPEYLSNGKWLQCGLDEDTVSVPKQGTLRLVSKGNPMIPQYFLHFTLGKFQDGHYRTLEFEEGRELTDFPSPMPMDTGRYRLITGNRLENGSVLASMTFFTITEGRLSEVPVELRKSQVGLKPSGRIPISRLMITLPGASNPEFISIIADEKNLGNKVILLLDPEKEPSKHVLHDLGLYAEHFNNWSGTFIYAMPPEKSAQVMMLKSYGLPARHIVGTDTGDNILKALEEMFGKGLKEKLPLLALCDIAGNVYLFSAGYNIGIGEQILKTIPAAGL